MNHDMSAGPDPQDPDGDPEMMSSGTTQPDQAEGDDDATT